MWPFANKKAPEVERLIHISLSSREGDVKSFQKNIRKKLPHITDEEMTSLTDGMRNGSAVVIRVTAKASELFRADGMFSANRMSNLVELGGDHCRCGKHVCGSCTIAIKETDNFSSTDMGINVGDLPAIKIPKELRRETEGDW